jgi:hypothetical protein
MKAGSIVFGSVRTKGGHGRVDVSEYPLPKPTENNRDIATDAEAMDGSVEVCLQPNDKIGSAKFIEVYQSLLKFIKEGSIVVDWDYNGARGIFL